MTLHLRPLSHIKLNPNKDETWYEIIDALLEQEFKIDYLVLPKEKDECDEDECDKRDIKELKEINEKAIRTDSYIKPINKEDLDPNNFNQEITISLSKTIGYKEFNPKNKLIYRVNLYVTQGKVTVTIDNSPKETMEFTFNTKEEFISIYESLSNLVVYFY